MYHCSILGLLTLFCATNVVADDSPAILKLSKQHPIDLPTIVAASLPHPPDKPATFELSHPSMREPAVGQLDNHAGLVWFPITVREPSLLGKTLEFTAKLVPAKSRVTANEMAGGLLLQDAGRNVLFYQRDPKSSDGGHTRANYVHPLYNLDGDVITEVFPSDHRHHHGVFWAWHQLWVGGKMVGDPWLTKDFLAVVREAKVVDRGPVFATLRLEVDWTSPLIKDDSGAKKPIVKETTTLRVFCAAGDSQYIDFTIVLKPQLPDVKIGGADAPRGYSGFTVRLKPPSQMKIRDAHAELAEDGVGRVSPWAGVSGKFGKLDRVSGIGILCHGSLPEFPPKWLVRHYGMQNVVYPGRHPVLLSAEKPLVLRHRLVLHRGHTTQARMADHQHVYEMTPLSSSRHHSRAINNR